MRHLEFVMYKYFCRLTLGRSFKSMWSFSSGGSWGNIFACGAVTKFGIFKFLAVAVKADRLKPVRNDFQSVYFFIGRREGTFYTLEPLNKHKYVWPSRLRRIDAFDSVLSASFVAILLSPSGVVRVIISGGGGNLRAPKARDILGGPGTCFPGIF